MKYLAFLLVFLAGCDCHKHVIGREVVAESSCMAYHSGKYSVATTCRSRLEDGRIVTTGWPPLKGEEICLVAENNCCLEHWAPCQ